MPIVIFTVVFAMFLTRREQETFERGARELTRALMTAVDLELRSSITTLEALATDRRAERSDLRGFYETATRVLESQNDWFTINVALPSGQLCGFLARQWREQLKDSQRWREIWD